MLAEAEAYRVDPSPLDGLIFHPQYSLGSEPELKAEKGVVSVRQAEVLELLGCLEGEWVRSVARSSTFDPLGVTEIHEWQTIRIDVAIWRPSDVDAIAEALR